MPIKRGKPVFGQLHRGFMTIARRAEEERVGNTGDVCTHLRGLPKFIQAK